MTQLHRLNSAFVKSAPHGKHSDGQGLWLIKRSDGGAQWVLRISLGGKRREMGLGSANDVSLKEARELASEYRKLAKQGIDPINFRLAAQRALLKPGKSLANHGRQIRTRRGALHNRYTNITQSLHKHYTIVT